MARFLRGVAALLFLAGTLVGLPAALIGLAGNPLPHSITLAALRSRLLTPDDGSILLRVVAVVGWLAWAVFAACVLVELLRLVSGLRIRVRLPGLGGSQRLIAGLLLSIVSMLSSPQLSQAAPTPVPVAAEPVTQPPQHLLDDSLAGSQVVGRLRGAPSGQVSVQPSAEPTRGAEHTLTHVVERGDDLWDLAVRYYGEGREWRRIAAANPDRLTGGPDRLLPGWRLKIPQPQPQPHPEPSPQPHPTTAQRPTTPQHPTVVVRAGDTLSSIAEEAFGSPSEWRTIFAENRNVLSDPDEIAIGARLVLPSAPAKEVEPLDQGDATSEEGEPTGDQESSARPRKESEHSAGGSVQGRPVPSADDPGAPAQPAPQRIDPRESSTPASTTGGGSRPEMPAEDVPYGPIVAAVGGLLAAAALASLRRRRRLQLQSRPVGRRILSADPAGLVLETALAHRQTPLNLESLDLAARAVAADCRSASVPVPALTMAKVSEQCIELVLAEPNPRAPTGFTASGSSWLLAQQDAGYVATIPGVLKAPRPYPALVSIGTDAAGAEIVLDLEAAGLLAVEPTQDAFGERFLGALAVQLSCSDWSDELVLTLVGGSGELAQALGKHNVTRTDDLDGLLDRLERRSTVQREHGPHRVLAQHRIDPDLSDPWVPEVVLVDQQLNPAQQARVVEVFTSRPRVTLAAVVAGAIPTAPWRIAALHAGTATQSDGARGPAHDRAVLQPLGVSFEPQLLEAPARKALVGLLATTGSEETTAAPWWSSSQELSLDQGRPPDNVAYLGRRFGGWGSDGTQQEGVGDVELGATGAGGGATAHPILALLGAVELWGATGTLPPRAGKQCLEYCGWLLENPGTTAQAMASALIVAEGTRRSNMSRLRTWLGSDAEGNPYLPDAYTGRIMLHSSVSSDWQRLQILTARGVDVTSTDGLRAALQLVRGAPLADAAPGQWHWAEELRTDMISAVRDIGVELAGRALAEHDIDLARWAAARALAAAPGDELLMAARIRTEHQAGNVVETERLTLQLAAQARALGVDLDEETVALLQQVLEGRVRARLA